MQTTTRRQWGADREWIVAHDPLPIGVLHVTPTPGVTYYPLGSSYVERYWTPVLGPSAIILARLCSSMTGVSVPLTELGQAIGVSKLGTSRNSPVVRALSRLTDFGAARVAAGEFQLASSMPEIPDRLMTRLPEMFVQELHMLKEYAA